MKDEEFEKALKRWAKSEMESAPDLRPTAEMIRLVRAKQTPPGGFPTPLRWAVAAVAVAGVLLIAIVAVLLVRSGAIPGQLPTPQETLIAQRQGPVEVQTVIVVAGGKGQPGEGTGRGMAAFRQLLLETQLKNSTAVQAVDLLDPPEETLVLTADDSYRLVLEPIEELHVYVYQMTSSGNLVQLLPNPAYSPALNPLLPRRAAVLPAEPFWLYLDEVPGEERLYVVASPQPIGDLDELYSRYVASADEATRRESLSDLLDLLESVPEAHLGSADAVQFAFQQR